MGFNLKGLALNKRMAISLAICPFVIAILYVLSIYDPVASFFFPLLSAMALLLMPYVLGIPGIKRCAKMGLVSLIAAGILFSVVDSHITYNVLEIEEVSSPDGELRVFVHPEMGTADEEYTFTLTYQGSENGTMYLVLRTASGWEEHQMSEGDPMDNDTLDGKEYIYTTDLDPGVYAFYCKANLSSNTTVKTETSFGPITASFAELYPGLLISGILRAVLFVAPFFLLFLFLYYWFRSRGRTAFRGEAAAGTGEAEGEAADEGPQEGEASEDGGGPDSDGKGGSFICSSCGTEVEVDASACPECGEGFD